MEDRIYDEILIESSKMCAETRDDDKCARKIKSASDIVVEWLYFDKSANAEEKTSIGGAKKYAALSFDFKTLIEKDERVLLIKETAAELRKLIKEYGYSTENVLVIGLGNRNIQADSLGVSVTEKISRSDSKIKTFAPSIEALTGYPSFDAISAITEMLRPTLIFAVDTLSAKSVNRLGSFLQFSNGGISAGSGVNNRQPTISERSLGTPVIAIGVPLVIYAKTIARSFMAISGSTVPNADQIISDMLEGNENSFVVAPTSISLCIDVLSEVISEAIQQTIKVTPK